MNEISKNLVALVGPPCSGKSAILKRLLELYPDEFEIPKSFTTRAPREGENGSEYDFISSSDFAAKRERGELLEWTYYCGNYYGMSKKAVLDILKRGRIPIRAMDVNGAVNLGCFSIYVDRTLADMISALYDRCADQKELFVKRLVQIYEDMLADKCSSIVRNNRMIDEVVQELYELIQNNADKAIPGMFSSVWADGRVITTNCMVDLVTKEIFNIEVSAAEPPDCSLIEEFVTIGEDRYPVFRRDEADDNDFWYE